MKLQMEFERGTKLLQIILITLIFIMIMLSTFIFLTMETKFSTITFTVKIEAGGEISSITPYYHTDGIDIRSKTIDSLTPSDIETIMMLHKYNVGMEVDGVLDTYSINVLKLLSDITGSAYDTLSDYNLKEFMIETQNQYSIRTDWKYDSQRDEDKAYANRVCVPASAVMLSNQILANLDSDKRLSIPELVQYFENNQEIIEIAKDYGKWTQPFIKNNTLYQITGIFVYGLNRYIEESINDFPFIFDYNYWTIAEIEQYIDRTNLGIMIPTFLPNLILKGQRTGGHMTVLLDIIYHRDIPTLVRINDSFGNPNTKYADIDGENIMLEYAVYEDSMKSYYDDTGKGSKSKIRVLYFTLK